tara:strand:- start:486 stop:629 length:144 start_codon:yes stop_codon:yes gene_type:complete
MQLKGLGDTIDQFTRITGIKKLTKKFLGNDCGCKKRQKKLNEILPYK